MSRGLTLDVSDDLFQRIERKAASTGRAMEDVALAWLKSAADREIPEPTNDAADPLVKFIGALDSGGVPWAEQHDEFLGREYLNTHDEVHDP